MTPNPEPRARGTRSWPAWVWTLLVGSVLWLVTAGVALSTSNILLVPEVLLIGGFLVPVTALLWIMGTVVPVAGGPAVGRTALDGNRILAAFVLGGGVGLMGSALIEDAWTKAWPRVFYFDVAVTEELVKFAMVWLLALPLAFYLRRDGMLLGGAVGLGFSALESTGYAFNQIVNDRLLTLEVIQVQLVRGVLAPVGHGLWTALVAGALFAAANGGRLRFTWSVAGWLAGVLALHALWDMSHGIAAAAVLIAEGGTPTRDLIMGTGYSAAQASSAGLTVELISGAIQTGIAVVGLLLLVHYWRSTNDQLVPDN